MNKNYLKARYQKEIKKIVKKIVIGYRPQKVIVFGGAATGDLHPESDIDLLIIKETQQRYLDRVKRVARLLDTDLPTDIFIYTPAELNKAIEENRFFIVDEVLPKGKVVYEQTKVPSGH